MIKKLASFTNIEDGVESYVVAGVKGFNVIFTDLDAGEILPIVRIFSNEADAIAEAKKNVGL